MKSPPRPSAMYLQCVLLMISLQTSTASVTKSELPHNIQACYDSYRKVSLKDVVGQSICWACEKRPIKNLQTRVIDLFQEPSTRAYVQTLVNELDSIVHGSRNTQRRKCIRREYRMLSDTERNRFHDAINTLKSDTSVVPNRYDVIARMHSRSIRDIAHGGPNFLGWHRAYLVILEQELQTVDPGVCIPYWDSSLDNELSTPANSQIFSPAFLGGTGIVVDGPFAGWDTNGFGRLNRQIGAAGELISEQDVLNVLSRTRTSEITRTRTSTPTDSYLEGHHNGVHVFVGGQMRTINSAHDPAFFLHHSFIDYIWELFRIKQRASGIDPQTDYPRDYPEFHEPNRTMGFSLNITAYQGYSDNLTSTYEYELSPTCSSANPDCGSRYLQCNQRYRCVPVDPSPATAQAEADQPPIAIQNSFCADGVCDMREWVYIPVKVISVRSPELKSYNSYPVYNGTIDKLHDIYEPSPFTSYYRTGEIPKGYRKCQDGRGKGLVYIQSEGLSYEGFYKESVIIDQRMPTSMSVGYLAVKDPKSNPEKVLLRAFDSCGRICRTACKIPGTEDYEPCSGVFDVQDDPTRPQQYSKTYGQVFHNTWDYRQTSSCPSFLEDDIMLTFHCDYSLQFPWLSQTSPIGGASISTSSVIPSVQQLQNHHSTASTASTSTSTMSKMIQRLSRWLKQKSSSSTGKECKVDEECTISVACKTARKRSCRGKKFPCKGLCDKYAECFRGKYRKKTCQHDWVFDESASACKPAV